MNTETIILTRSQVANLLSQRECLNAVEQVFRLYGEGKTNPPGILGVHAQGGGFHIKAGLMNLGQSYFVAKMNANFPGNPKKFQLPTIQGVIIVSDASNGRLLALTDSIEITIQRTGAATAVAAKYLAKKDSERLAIIGCGNQGRVSIDMLMEVFPIKHISLFDEDINYALQLAEKVRRDFDVEVRVTDTIPMAVADQDIVVTCTPSRTPLLTREMISSGTFIAAVGSDNEDKQELHEELVSCSKIITDVTEQCVTIGELHHAIAKGLVTREHVHAQLGDIVAGTMVGRTSDEEVIIFDSTGMALQDVVTTAVVYEKATVRKDILRTDFLG